MLENKILKKILLDILLLQILVSNINKYLLHLTRN